MKQYDAICPLCGTENKNMFLEETDGWMECEHCHATVQVMQFEKAKKIPIYTPKQLGKLVANGRLSAIVG